MKSVLNKNKIILLVESLPAHRFEQDFFVYLCNFEKRNKRHQDKAVNNKHIHKL